MYGLDGEEIWYADFSQGKGFYPQPDFIGHMTYTDPYSQALADYQTCKINLGIARKGNKDMPRELGKNSTLSDFKRVSFADNFPPNLIWAVIF